MMNIQPKACPDSIIDFHVHLFPDRIFEAIWKQFVIDYGWGIIHRLYYQECIDYLRCRGVQAIVYSNYAHKKGIARKLNEWNIKVLEDNPDLYCFAAYHPGDEEALSMAAELLEHPRIMGFKLQLLVQQFYPQDRRLFPLYDMVMEKGKRIQFHIGTGPVGNNYVGVDHFKEVLQYFPDMAATISHMGALEYDAFGALLDTNPNLYLDTAYAFIPQLGCMFNLGNDFLERHQDRILYGSDFPNIIFPREVEIDTLLGLHLSQAFYDKIFRDNGLRLITKTAGK
jgi:hypothetical protein